MKPATVANPTSGRVLLGGTDLTALGPRAMRPYRRRIQLVFQEPYASLHPRRTVEQALSEVLGVHGLATRGAERAARVTELMEMVGLASRLRDRFPVHLSGGQLPVRLNPARVPTSRRGRCHSGRPAVLEQPSGRA
jgi:peptide/nickel transport system ATP-binding protein